MIIAIRKYSLFTERLPSDARTLERMKQAPCRAEVRAGRFSDESIQTRLGIALIKRENRRILAPAYAEVAPPKRLEPRSRSFISNPTAPSSSKSAPRGR